MVKLSPAQLRAIRKDLEGRDNNSGKPFWTDRCTALLDHIELLEQENERLRQMDLFGAADGRNAKKTAGAA
jgi:hypothetical protein